ncbi:MAG: DegV family protein [Clostridia bacterium]|nr:DegV family protein [Clostridia bacterium]
MKKFEILADMTCDLGREFTEKYDLRLLPGHLKFPGDVEMTAFVEWKDIAKEEFYASLKKDPDGFSTAPPNSREFADAMEEVVKNGTPLLVMTISSGISGAYGFAVTARDSVLEKYPNAEISVVDTMRFGPGFGLMVVYAAMLREEGKTLSEVTEYLENNKNRFHQAGWLDDLSFVAKKGRLTHAKAFFGTLAGVKPIGEFDYNGLTTVIGKAKGTKAAYAALLDYIEKTVENPEDQIFFIAQTNRMPQAEEYRRLIDEKFHPKAIFINDVFPSCGINIGPGLMAAYYIGKPISQDLSEERAILESFMGKGE